MRHLITAFIIEMVLVVCIVFFIPGSSRGYDGYDISGPGRVSTSDLSQQQQYAHLELCCFHLATEGMSLANMNISLYLASGSSKYLTDANECIKTATAYLNAADQYDALINYTVLAKARTPPKTEALRDLAEVLQARVDELLTQ